MSPSLLKDSLSCNLNPHHNSDLECHNPTLLSKLTIAWFGMMDGNLGAVQVTCSPLRGLTCLKQQFHFHLCSNEGIKHQSNCNDNKTMMSGKVLLYLHWWGTTFMWSQPASQWCVLNVTTWHCFKSGQLLGLVWFMATLVQCGWHLAVQLDVFWKQCFHL